MKARRASIILSTLAIAAAPLASAIAAELPPANAKPLSAILASVQSRNIGSLAEAEFDHGRWEITVCKAVTCQKLLINPLTGVEESRRATSAKPAPSPETTPIAKIIQQIETANVGVVTSVEFDHGHWEIKLLVPSGATR